MHASEREELIALRAEKIRLQAQVNHQDNFDNCRYWCDDLFNICKSYVYLQVQKNVEELRKCSRDHLHIVQKAEE